MRIRSNSNFDQPRTLLVVIFLGLFPAKKPPALRLGLGLGLGLALEICFPKIGSFILGLRIDHQRFVLFTFVRGIAGAYERHKRLARITYPMWLYVAVTGVVVYLMISPYYAH